jgi:hypothetical protein
MIAPKSKKESEHGARFATGGSTKMHKPQAAGPAKPSVTGKTQTLAPGSKRASGGSSRFTRSSSTSAKPGHTGPDSVHKKGR